MLDDEEDSVDQDTLETSQSIEQTQSICQESIPQPQMLRDIDINIGLVSSPKQNLPNILKCTSPQQDDLMMSIPSSVHKHDLE